MKTYLFFLNFLLICIFSHPCTAIEHSINISAGPYFSTNTIKQNITYSYKNPITNKTSETSLERIFYSNNSGSSFHIFYQSKYKLYNFIGGLSYFNSTYSFTYPKAYKPIDTPTIKIHYKTIESTLGTLFNIYESYNFIKPDILNKPNIFVSLGLTLGLSYMYVNINNTNLFFDGKNDRQLTIIPKIVIMGEYLISNHIGLFATINLPYDRFYKYSSFKTNLSTLEDNIKNSKNTNITNNTLSFKHDRYFVVNLGLKYQF